MITPLLAVSSNMLRELLRRASSYMFLLLVVVSAAVIPHAASGESSLLMRLQLDVSYGMGLPIFLIGVAAVGLSAAALSREVETRRTQLLVTKPIASWQIVAGKFLGILLVVATLLFAVLCVFAVNVSLARRSSETEPWELKRAHAAFFTVRESAPVLHSHDDGLRGGDGPEEEGRSGKRGEHPHRVSWLRAHPGESLALPFRVSPRPGDDNELLRVIYRIYSSDPQGAPRLDVTWRVGPPGEDAKPFVEEQEALHGTPQELYLPVSVLSEGGELLLQLHNSMAADSRAVLLLNPERVEVLSIGGRFWPNVLRVFLLIFGQLLLLSSLCLLGSAVFAFPTVTFMGLFLYTAALSSGFLQETFDLYTSDSFQVRSTMEVVVKRMAALGSYMLSVLPDFSRLDPLGRLSGGRLLGVGELLHTLLWVVGVESLAAMGAAAWLFRRRELGKS